MGKYKGRTRFKSTTGFNDILFNLLVGFVFLFIIAFLLINPPTKKEEAPKKAEYLIILEWLEKSADDVDLWVRDPNGITVSFTRKTGNLLNLEKDDLGASNDRWVRPDGSVVTIPINREVVTMRGIVPGRYQVAAHIYAKKDRWVKNPDTGQVEKASTSEGKLVATLVKINPYGELYRVSKQYNTKGQVFTLFNFEIDKEGKLLAIDERRNSIVYRGGTNMEGQN